MSWERLFFVSYYSNDRSSNLFSLFKAASELANKINYFWPCETGRHQPTKHWRYLPQSLVKKWLTTFYRFPYLQEIAFSSATFRIFQLDLVNFYKRLSINPITTIAPIIIRMVRIIITLSFIISRRSSFRHWPFTIYRSFLRWWFPIPYHIKHEKTAKNAIP